VFEGNENLASGEILEQPEHYVDKAAGYSVATVKMERFMHEYLKATIRPENDNAGRKRISDSEFEPATPSDNGLSDAIKTFDRWTVPPPLVYKDAAGNQHVQTRVEQRIGPWRKQDGSDAPRAHVHYISERWGAFVFRDIDRSWDYMNVHVRGLRPAYFRRGTTLQAFDVKASSAPDSARVPKSRLDPMWYRQDWVYLARFERLGDQFENFRDMVRPVREIWYLRSERAK